MRGLKSKEVKRETITDNGRDLSASVLAIAG